MGDTGREEERTCHHRLWGAGAASDDFWEKKNLAGLLTTD
jgi:hypothetical protein